MLIGIRDIANKAGVHQSTVSLALRNSKKLPDRTKLRIQRIAQELNYTPNYLAKGLAGEKTQTIGILVPKLRDLYAIEIIAAQERWLKQQSYASHFVVTHADPAEEIKAIDGLLGRGIDAIAFNYIPTDTAVMDKIERLVNAGTIMSFLGSTELRGVDQVTCDGVKAGNEIGRHLISLGHKRIATIGLTSCDYRIFGCRKAFDEAGIDIDPNLAFEVDYVFQDITQMSKNIMSLRDRPTAIFAYNDDLAGELIYELSLLGYKIPEDISIVGHNDGYYSPRLRVPLTTYHLPHEEIGISVVQPLLERLEEPGIEPRKKVFEGYLVERDSTGPACFI